MEEPARPPLPWEQKVAIGCLILLCLQEVHEGFLDCFGGRSPGGSSLQSAWTILLALFFGLAMGLHQRSRMAWWLTVGLVGIVALLHLGDTCDPIQRLYRAEEEAFAQRPMIIVCRTRPPVDRFGAFWLIAKNSFLAAAPAVLLLGSLRKSLSRAPIP